MIEICNINNEIAIKGTIKSIYLGTAWLVSFATLRMTGIRKSINPHMTADTVGIANNAAIPSKLHLSAHEVDDPEKCTGISSGRSKNTTSVIAYVMKTMTKPHLEKVPFIRNAIQYLLIHVYIKQKTTVK